MQRRASSSYGATMAPVGTDVEARGAGAAMRRLRRRRRQRQIGVDLAQEEPRALVAREEQRVLAAPAEPGLGGERHLEHRRAVGEYAIAELADLVADRRGEALQAGAQNLVVVAAQRIARDERPARIGKHVVGRARRRRQVIHPRGDDADGAGNEFRRPGAGHAMARHVVHRAVAARGEPLQEVRFFGGKFHVRDADLLEARFAAPLHNPRGERRPVAIGVRRRAGDRGGWRGLYHARQAYPIGGIRYSVRCRNRHAVRSPDDASWTTP